MASCENCRFWLYFNNGHSGSCRRRAPVPVHIGHQGAMRVEDRFPATSKNEWCGEHERVES